MSIIVAALAFYFGVIALAAYAESRDWNGGICRESGMPWRRFDTDSGGARGYSDGAGRRCWISYSVDRSYKHER